MDAIKSLETLQSFVTALTNGAYVHFVQAKCFEHQGLKELAKKYDDHAKEEMEWVGKFIDRIYDLDGEVKIEKREDAVVVKDPVEYLKVDNELQKQGVAYLYDMISLVHEDPTTYNLLKEYLADEENDLYWNDEQLHLLALVGKENWLAKQM